jgi:hypothetical protein
MKPKRLRSSPRTRPVGTGSKPRFRKYFPGERASLLLAGNPIPVEILEDRGMIGREGRRFVRVRRLDDSTDDPSTFDAPASNLTFSES